MIIEKGKDKDGATLYSASQKGCMGRMCVCESTDYHKAINGVYHLLDAQKSQQYALEQQQTALSMQNDPAGEDMG